jgi:putative DNA primase/helicase
MTTLYRGPTAADLDQIPAALLTLNQWVLWRGTDRVNQQTGEVKLSKIPICPQTLHNADSTDPQTWGTLRQCVAALPCALEEWDHEAGPASRGGGIGFVLTEMDPYCGIDLDGCVHPDTGTIAAWAQDHMDSLESYTEVTPSGTGLHILVQGTLPPHGRKKGQVETYDYARFFTVTGWRVPGTPKAIEDRHDALQHFHRTIFGEARPAQDHGHGGVVTLEDTALLTKARATKNGARFAALFAGNWTGYTSQSEADMSLCVRLAFWSQSPAQIDRLFRGSGLMREKWDETRGAQTYGARTIAEALARQTEHYSRGAASPVVGRSANIARYRRQISADPYFGAPPRLGTGITPAVLVTEQEMIHG